MRHGNAVADRLRARAAVADDRADAEERRAAESARRRSPKHVAYTSTLSSSCSISSSRNSLDSTSPSLIFSATLPVNPSQTITSASPAVDVARFDVADERRQRRLQQPVRFARQLVALGRFLADREQTDPRRLDAERDPGVDAAHHRELQEVLPAGTRRWRRRRAARRDGAASGWWRPAPGDRRRRACRTRRAPPSPSRRYGRR